MICHARSHNYQHQQTTAPFGQHTSSLCPTSESMPPPDPFSIDTIHSQPFSPTQPQQRIHFPPFAVSIPHPFDNTLINNVHTHSHPLADDTTTSDDTWTHNPYQHDDDDPFPHAALKSIQGPPAKSTHSRRDVHECVAPFHPAIYHCTAMAVDTENPLNAPSCETMAQWSPRTEICLMRAGRVTSDTQRQNLYEEFGWEIPQRFFTA
ncbi:hypothetical protein B0H16DRAFT_1900281 [Mycena metata]|uniref:Uncharacterized protein n=1 Tax=Mycena metata TaxID=1033252 RepID=A0AAD7H4W5_9AGAR|nr:hypothetical protein B0H16DRAFT_1900281 [Mycena metata]